MERLTTLLPLAILDEPAMEQLPADLQAVVRLRMVEGLRFREIAERLQVPLGTALSRMQQALTRLSRKLSD